jgi:hypothetical protein
MGHPALRVLAVGLVSACSLFAQDPTPNLQFSAFGTLGEVSTTTDQIGFRRDRNQPGGAYRGADWAIDSRFGVQASAQVTPELLGTLQVVSKWGTDGSWRPQVTEGCLAWSPSPGWTLRGGVIDTYALPTDEYNEVGLTYLWVRPPVETFGNLPFTRLVGLEVRRIFDLGAGLDLEAVLRAGKANEKVFIDHVGEVDTTGTKRASGWLRLLAPNWRLRVGYSDVSSSTPLPPTILDVQTLIRNVGATLQAPAFAATAGVLDITGRRARSMDLDGTWERGPWQTQGVLVRNLYDSPTFPALWNGYVSVGRSLGKVIPYGVFSRIVSRRTPYPDIGTAATAPGPLGDLARNLAEYVDYVIDAAAFDRSTTSLGLRWDFLPQADLKFQVDHVVSPKATGLFYNPTPGIGTLHWDGHMTVFTVTLDFVLGGGR